MHQTVSASTKTVNMVAAFNLLKIVLDVENALRTHNNMWANSIKQAIHNKQPYTLIVNTIKDAATDNKKAIVAMLGLELTNKILAA